MLKKLLISAFLLLAAPAFAQNVQQSGTVTRNHIPVWITSGAIGDGGSSVDSPISSIGITNNGGNGLCINSARLSTGNYNALCFGSNTTGPATISLQNFGTAPAEPLQFIIDGTTYPFPGALAGITINGTSVTGGVNGDCLTVNALTVGQTACPIITAPTTGSGSVVFNTSPTLVGTIGGNLTWSGNQTYSGNATFNGQVLTTGTTFPAQSPGNTILAGTLASPTLTSQGQGVFYNTVANGGIVQGDGSIYDVSLLNKGGTIVLGVPTGSSNVTLPVGVTLSGLSSGTCTNGLGLNASNQAITVACPGAASSIQVGVTTISSGSTGNIEYNNAGTLGELTGNGGLTTASANLQVDGNYTGWALSNCTLAASVNSNLLTVALKNNAGSDPSATSPCNVSYRNVTAATGSTTLVQQTAALSIGTNATGATLGSSNNTAFRFWVVVFNNAGTNVMALINCLNSTTIFPLNEGVIASSTAISASATSAGVFYTPNGTTVTSKAYRILGYVEYNSTGLVTAGTYASAPNFVQTFGPGIRKPGEPVQSVSTTTTTQGSSTSSTFVALSSGITLAITPTSAANLIKAETQGSMVNASAVNSRLQMSRGTTAATNLFGTVADINTGSTAPGAMLGYDFPNTTSSTTYAVQGKTTNNIGYPFSGDTAVMTLTEIMG